MGISIRRVSGRAAAAAAVAAVVAVGVSASPAMAGADSNYSYGEATQCTHSSKGWFTSYGDVLNISDICSDGFSGLLEVDVSPLQTGYDFLVWDSKGAGTTQSTSHDVPEGTTVCVNAGIGHRDTGEMGGFEQWVCGVA
jgi:hypothetical protein